MSGEKPLVPEDAVEWLREVIDSRLAADIGAMVNMYPRVRRDAYTAACRVLQAWKAWESDPYNAVRRRAVREAAEALRALLARAGL